MDLRVWIPGAEQELGSEATSGRVEAVDEVFARANA